MLYLLEHYFLLALNFQSVEILALTVPRPSDVRFTARVEEFTVIPDQVGYVTLSDKPGYQKT